MQHGSRYQPSVEGRQLPIMGRGQGKQIAVRHLSRLQQSLRTDVSFIKQADIVRPKRMTRKRPQSPHHLRHRSRSSRRVWIPWMADNPHHPILGQWTSGPRIRACGREPVMRTIMLNVGRINQRNQRIHIQKKPTHGSLSSSCRTSSELTLEASGRTAKRGTPLRKPAPGSTGRKAFRTSEDTTSPILFFCIAANSFAAASTSSSKARVVCTPPPLSSIIIHHTSTCGR